MQASPFKAHLPPTTASQDGHDLPTCLPLYVTLPFAYIISALPQKTLASVSISHHNLISISNSFSLYFHDYIASSESGQLGASEGGGHQTHALGRLLCCASPPATHSRPSFLGM